MRTLLAGFALAIGMVFASQACALPCTNGTWQNGHYVCADYDTNRAVWAVCDDRHSALPGSVLCYQLHRRTMAAVLIDYLQ